jgi:hypothetical protein
MTAFPYHGCIVWRHLATTDTSSPPPVVAPPPSVRKDRIPRSRVSLFLLLQRSLRLGLPGPGRRFRKKRLRRRKEGKKKLRQKCRSCLHRMPASKGSIRGSRIVHGPQPRTVTRSHVIFRRVHKIAKSVCYLRHICLYVCLSVRIEQLGCPWTNFY